MDIELIVAIYRRGRARIHALFINSLTVVFCCRMFETEIFKKINEGRLALVGGYVNEIVFIFLSEPEDFL